MAGLQPLTTARARARVPRSAAAAVAVALLGSLGVVVMGASPAGAALACQVDEGLLSQEPTGSILDATASDDAGWIAFSDSDDLTGDNPDEELQVFLLQRSTGALEQITEIEDNGEFQYTGDPSISADGDHIAFESDSDLTGDNPDLSSEIFLYTRSSEQTVQITDTDEGLIEYTSSPSISADASHRNVTLGQSETGLTLRLRTPWSGPNGREHGAEITWPDSETDHFEIV